MFCQNTSRSLRRWIFVDIHHISESLPSASAYWTILCKKVFFLVDLCTHHKQYRVEKMPSPICSDKYISSILFVWILNSFFAFFKCPQELYVNPGNVSCISGMNWSPGNKNMFIIVLNFYILTTKHYLLNVSCSKELFLIDSIIRWSLALW